jgi:hypothetical protein
VSFSGSTMGRHSRLWLIITGVILLAVAVVLVIAFAGIPLAGAAIWPTAAILGVVGLILIVVGIIVGQRAAAVDKILTSGIAGTAQITGLTQTGMYLNEQPQVSMNLIVSLPGRTPYAATHKSFVPLILLGRLTSGAPLPVKVDQADPQKIVIDWQNAGFGAPIGIPMANMTSGFGMGTASMEPMPPMQVGMQPMDQPMTGVQPLQPMVQPMQPMGQPMQQMADTGGATGSGIDENLNQVKAALSAGGSTATPFATPDQGNYSVEQLRAFLRQSGVQGEARINKAQDMGTIVGDERLYTMQLTLEAPGRPPQELAESAAMVPLRAMHKVHVGWKIPVRFAADNPNLLMFEWDKV